MEEKVKKIIVYFLFFIIRNILNVEKCLGKNNWSKFIFFKSKYFASKNVVVDALVSFWMNASH